MGSEPEFETLVDLFDHSIENFGPRELFGTKRGGVWSWTTYAEFGAAVDRVRRGLAAIGVQRDDRVALVSNNRVEWAETAYACYGAGAVFVPMYEAQAAGEWELIVRDCEAKVLVVSSLSTFEKARSLIGKTPSIKHVVVMADELKDAAFGDARVVTYPSLMAAEAAPSSSFRPAPNDLAMLIYTSGTTGVPKGVMLTHRNVASNVTAIHKVLHLEHGDRSLAFLPWAHVFGQTSELHQLFSSGASIAVCEGPDKILDNLAEVRPTIMFSVPAIFNRLYTAVQQQLATKPKIIRAMVGSALEIAAAERRGGATKPWDRALMAVVDRLVFRKVRARFGGRLRYASSGGAALSKEVAEFIDALGITVFEGYGLTETSPVVSTNYPGVRKMGTVGPPVPGVRVAIDSSAGHGEGSAEGEIIVYGPNVMKGYFNRPEETAAVFTADGGFRTGDMGRLDADGFLSITGRIKEQYKLENGKYVVPTSLEEQLKLSPYVANVMVYGDNRPHNVALVVANVTAVKKWADDQKLTLPGDTTALLADDRVQKLFREEIARLGAAFKGFEAVRAFRLLSDPFTTDNGMLTPKLSLRRRKVIERYKTAIDALYLELAPSKAAS